MTGTVYRPKKTLTLLETTRSCTSLRANLNIEKSKNSSLELGDLVPLND
ncbi:MAG: hypothetical protein ACJA2Q_002596 [Pseudohongiellaceae bacterium]|jgi:hypothetical protein